MKRSEEFSDPVVVPGPNLRSRFPDTEEVAGDTSELVTDTGVQRCPRCGRALPTTALVCPDDGTGLVELPPQDRG